MMIKWGCAVAGLMVGAMPMAAVAQEQQPQPGATTPAPTAAPAATVPQSAPAEPLQDDAGGEEIVVNGVLRGAVPGDVKPEVQLGPAEIRAYGASNVTELMNALTAQLGSGSGRGDEQPVVLLSGRRSSFIEIRNIPTEAIERVDILPEEAALQYGYGANQKVINFVLRRRFQALTTVVEGAMPLAGGNAGEGLNANLQKINRNERLEIDLKYGQNSGLLESERGVTRATSSLFDVAGNITGINGGEIDPALSALAGEPVTLAGVPAGASGTAPTLAGFAGTAGTANVSDLTAYRTLTASGRSRRFGDDLAPLSGTPQRNFSLSGTYTPAISDKVSAFATVGVTANHSESLLGLPSATLRLPTGNPYSPFANDVQLYRYLDGFGPLSRESDRRSINGNLTVNGTSAPWIASWNWSLQAEYVYSESNSVTATGFDLSAAQALLDAGDPSFNPFGAIGPSLAVLRPDQISKSNSNRANVDFATYGTLFKLPAGDARASVRVAGRTEDQHSFSLRNSLSQLGDISRDTGSIRGNLTLPITSRRLAVLDAIGDLSVNGNLQVEQVSDFGSLVTTGYGFNWAPISQIRANVSWTQDRNAPSATQLADPVLITPNVRIFDYVRGESVDITAITGGNAALRADSRHVFRVGLNVRPLAETNLTLIANYTKQRNRNIAGAFPGPTAEVEAAFPERFTRDASGQLLSVDYRPINFDRTEREELRWGFNLFLPISSPAQKRLQARRTAFQEAMRESRRTGQPLPPEMQQQLDQFRRLGQQQSLFGGSQFGPGQRQGQGQGQGPRQGQPPASGQEQRPANQGQNQAPPEGARPDGQAGPGGGGRFGPGGGGSGGGFGGGGGRRGFGGGRGGGGNTVQLSLYHTWVFRDERVIRAGLPVLDYLNGAALGNGGGTPAHQLELQAGIQRDGFRLRLDGNWQSATQVRTGTLASGDELNFGSLATLSLTAQADLGQQVDLLLKHPWLRGTRVSFRIDNLLNARQRVTDESGVVPAAYAPNLVDPLGRVVRLSVRKLFF